jgi:hypothetical protein
MVDVKRAYFNAVVPEDTPIFVELPLNIQSMGGSVAD